MKINEIYGQSYTDGQNQKLLLKGNFDYMMYNNNYTIVQKIGKYNLVKDNEKSFLALFLVENNKPIGQYNFGIFPKIQGKDTYKPGWIYTLPNYRRKGLAISVYNWILNRPNTVIMSDNSHTLYSRILWKGLLGKFHIYSYNYEVSSDLNKINTIEELNEIYKSNLRLVASKEELNENK